MMKDAATIMMVTYNRLDLTKQTLDHLFNNTNYPFNLVVVDNFSTDGTVEWLNNDLAKNKLFDGDKHSLLLRFNDSNRGIATGRNQALKSGIDKFGTNWYVTLDNDVFLPNGWLTEAIEILKSNRQYGAIGVNMEGRPYPLVNLNGKEFQHKPQGNLGTACMVFGLSLHKMIGFFDYFDNYAHEDADFGFRTRLIGFKLGYIKEMGKHLGEGKHDVGPYREFKNEWHAKNLSKFNQNCRAYANKQKPVFINFVDERTY